MGDSNNREISLLLQGVAGKSSKKEMALIFLNQIPTKRRDSHEQELVKLS